MPAKKAAPVQKKAGAVAKKQLGVKKAAAKKGAKKIKVKKNADLPLFDSKPRNFGIGNAIAPKRDLTRFVRWPKYIKIQRQRRVLLKRGLIPPAINQFSNALDKNTALRVFALLDKYRPEDKKAKHQRLKAIAEAKVKGEAAASERPPNVVKFGLNHVTALIEQKKARLVLIAHDVAPIELVVWLPALCRRMGVPYAIVKGKARLGQVVHQKTATCLAFVNVNKEDLHDFTQLQTAIKESYLDRFAEINKKWGGRQLGHKSISASNKRRRAIAKAKSQKKVV
jgi:large subunit ribosomal protein L7Ae